MQVNGCCAHSSYDRPPFVLPVPCRWNKRQTMKTPAHRSCFTTHRDHVACPFIFSAVCRRFDTYNCSHENRVPLLFHCPAQWRRLHTKVVTLSRCCRTGRWPFSNSFPHPGEPWQFTFGCPAPRGCHRSKTNPSTLRLRRAVNVSGRSASRLAERCARRTKFGR